jgi:hypothetical protein
MKTEQIECSETSAYKIQMPGNHPEENIQQHVSGFPVNQGDADKCTHNLHISHRRKITFLQYCLQHGTPIFIRVKDNNMHSFPASQTVLILFVFYRTLLHNSRHLRYFCSIYEWARLRHSS